QPLAEGEVLEVESEIDRQALAAGPVVGWPLVQRRIVVPVMVPQLHAQTVALSDAMGYVSERMKKPRTWGRGRVGGSAFDGDEYGRPATDSRSCARAAPACRAAMG